MAQNERVESTKTFFYDYDDFIMIFYGFIRSISDLKSIKAFQVLTELTRFVNYDTGEVHSIETSKFQSERIHTDQFYITFFKYMQNYLKIKSAKTLFLISELCSRAEWNTGKVLLPVGAKKRNMR